MLPVLACTKPARFRAGHAYHQSIVGCRTVLGNGAVGAGDGVAAGIVIPIGSKGDRLPLRGGAAELNARQTAEIGRAHV